MPSVVSLGNGIEVDLEVTQKCAEDALKVIEKGLPAGVRCRDVYNLVIDDMKRIIATSPISISQKYPEGQMR